MVHLCKKCEFQHLRNLLLVLVSLFKKNIWIKNFILTQIIVL